MSAVKDRMVYVPIPPDHTLNTMDTVLRTPSEAGIIPVKVKRKMEYKHSYMEEYVSIPKLIASLRLLLKIRHPEYKFLTEEMIQDYEARLQKRLCSVIAIEMAGQCNSHRNDQVVKYSLK